MIARINAALRRGRFLRDEKGAVAIEAALVIPLFLTLFLGGATTFSILRSGLDSTSHTETVADILSRKPVIDDPTLNLLYDLQKELSGITDDARATLVITSIHKQIDPTDSTKTVLVPTWQYDSATRSSKDTGITVDMSDLPLLSTGDSVLIIKTSLTKPMIIKDSSGMPDRTYNRTVRITPRFVNHIRHRTLDPT